MLEKFQHILLVITLTFFKIGRILNVDDVALFIQNHQNGKAESGGIAQPLHGFGVLVRLGIIDVNIDEIFANNLIDC